MGVGHHRVSDRDDGQGAHHRRIVGTGKLNAQGLLAGLGHRAVVSGGDGKVFGKIAHGQGVEGRGNRHKHILSRAALDIQGAVAAGLGLVVSDAVGGVTHSAAVLNSPGGNGVALQVGKGQYAGVQVAGGTGKGVHRCGVGIGHGKRRNAGHVVHGNHLHTCRSTGARQGAAASGIAAEGEVAAGCAC